MSTIDFFVVFVVFFFFFLPPRTFFLWTVAMWEMLMTLLLSIK